MSVAGEARAEANYRFANYPPPAGPLLKSGFEQGAEWQASRKPEAAPSDTDERETLAGIVQDAGEYVPGSHAADYVNPYLAADKILAAGFSRSQPVQVEVTNQVSLSRTLASYAATALAGSGDNGDKYAAKQIRAALGGGE